MSDGIADGGKLDAIWFTRTYFNDSGLGTECKSEKGKNNREQTLKPLLEYLHGKNSLIVIWMDLWLGCGTVA